MLKTINTDKLDYIEIIDDAVLFNNLYLIRTLNKLTAISVENYDLIWEIDVKGETLINLKNIFIIEDTIIVFSYKIDEDLYYISGINAAGKTLWRSTSDYQPNGKNAVCIKKGKLVYNGYSSKFTNTLIVEIDPKNGSLNKLHDLKTNTSYLCNLNDNLVLSGSSGIFLLENNNTLKMITDDFLESIIVSDEEKMIYVSQAEEEERYLFNLVSIDENFNRNILGKIVLDDRDRGNMFPFLNGDKVISFKGEHKGIVYTDLTQNREIWHIGNDKLKGVSVEILDEKNIAILHRDLDYNTNLYVYDLNTGDLIQKTDFEGISSRTFNFNGTLIVGSSLGMYIFEWQKN